MGTQHAAIPYVRMVTAPETLRGSVGPSTTGDQPNIEQQPRWMRFALAALAVGFYIGLGFLIRPDANTYLLLGMPITVAFQLAIARRPLRELWMRKGRAHGFDRWSW